MQILYDVNDRYKCYFIKGNKEDYWLKYRAGGERLWKDKNSTSGALLYAYNCLTCRDLDFFAQLQQVREITVGEMPVISDMHEVKLDEHAPYWSLITENILRGGNMSHSKILSRAVELCREETGNYVWPNIPERCWAQAVNEMVGL